MRRIELCSHSSLQVAPTEQAPESGSDRYGASLGRLDWFQKERKSA